MNITTKKTVIHITSLLLSICCIFVIVILCKSLLSYLHSIIIFIIGFSMAFGFDMLFNKLLKKIFIGDKHDQKTTTEKETVKTE